MGPVDRGLLGRLREAVSDGHVVTDPDVVAAFTTDWTGRFRGTSSAVVSPGDAAELAAVIGACRDAGAAVTPQGGNTGLVGGGVPLHGEVVVSLRRLRGVEVDSLSGQATAGAGATVADVRRAAVASGWDYGVDLGSRESATVGGTIATNAGGLRMLRYGDTRAQVLGLEAVLGDGSTVSHLSGLVKDNTGYHLPGLLCGSEGTLGVVAAARLRLVPLGTRPAVAVVALSSVHAALGAVSILRRAVPELSATEIFLRSGLELVLAHDDVGPPHPALHPVYLLVEATGEDPAARLAAALGSVDGVADAAVAEDPERCRALWRYREAHTEAIGAHGVPHKLDVTVPLPAYDEFVRAVPAAVASVAPSAETWLFGHVAEGNVHVNVTGVDPGDDRVDDAVLRLAAGLGGSISSEHGIGTAKVRWLSLVRSPAEIAAFRALKRALDPDGILNPYVLLPTT